MANSRRKKIIQNILLIFMGFAIAFVISEIVLRFHNPFAFRIKGDKIILFANEEYILKNDTASKLDKTILLRTNSIGFRGEEPPEDFDNYLTTITIGGSTTECSVLSEGKTWADVLGGKLNKSFRNIWVNNAGLDGHSTYGHIALMEDYITKIKPGNVLFLVGINDEGNNEIRGDFEDDKTIMKGNLDFKSLKGLGRSLANHSEFFSVILNLYRYYKASIAGLDHNTELDLSKSLVLELPDEIIEKALSKHRKFLGSYRERLLKLIQLSRDNGIEPIFITQPVLYGYAVDNVTNIDLAKIYKRKNVNGELAWKRLELYNDVVRQIGKDQNVFVIDLASEMPKSSRFFYDFSHYTNEGAEKVADIIYKKLCPYYKNKYNRFSTSTSDCIAN